WQQAYSALPKDANRDTEVAQMIRVCNLITRNWATSDRANDARMTLGQLYSQAKKPVESAKWYGEVPPAAAQYANAQLSAGQAYWPACLEAVMRPATERPAEAELKQWADAAAKHLQTGIDKISAGVSKEGTPPDEMVAAKVSLAQVKITNGQFTDAIK